MLQGNLKDRQVPALLADLYFSNKTGMLTIESDQVIKQLCIRDGAPVAARSSLIKDRLGDFLVGKGIITTEQQQRALEIQKKKQLGFAASLIEMDAVSKEKLFAETRRIFLTIIYSLFDLKEGMYRFEEMELPKKNLYYKVAFSGLLLFGVRQIWDSQSIEEIIGDLNTVPIPTQNFSKDQTIRFTENEQSVIQQIDSKRTINEILKSSEVASLIGLKVFLFLFLYRWIELVKSPPKEEPEEVTKIAELDESAQDVKSGYMEDEISRTVEGVLAVSDETHEPSLEKDEEIQSKEPEEVQDSSGLVESEEETSLTSETEPSKETTKLQGWPHILFEDLKPTSTVTEEQEIQELERPVEKEYAESSQEPVADEVDMASEEEQDLTEQEKPTSQEEEDVLIPSEKFQEDHQKKKKRVRKKAGLFSSLALIILVAAVILFISPWYDDVKDRVRTYFSGEQSEWASLEKSQLPYEDLSVPDDQGESKPDEKTLEVIPPFTIVVEPEVDVIKTESAENLVETEMVEIETAVIEPEKSPDIPAIQPEEEVFPPAAIEEGAGSAEESASLAEPEKPEKEKLEQEEIQEQAKLQEEDKLVQLEEKVKVGSAKVLGVHYTEEENSVRVVIDLDAPAEYKIFQLPEQHMVYLSLRNTRLSPEIPERRIIIPDRNLNAVRLGQYKSDKVRVVLDFDKVTVVSAFALTDPHRVILDVATSESDE